MAFDHIPVQDMYIISQQYNFFSNDNIMYEVEYPPEADAWSFHANVPNTTVIHVSFDRDELDPFEG